MHIQSLTSNLYVCPPYGDRLDRMRYVAKLRDAYGNGLSVPEWSEATGHITELVVYFHSVNSPIGRTYRLEINLDNVLGKIDLNINEILET